MSRSSNGSNGATSSWSVFGGSHEHVTNNYYDEGRGGGGGFWLIVIAGVLLIGGVVFAMITSALGEAEYKSALAEQARAMAQVHRAEADLVYAQVTQANLFSIGLGLLIVAGMVGLFFTIQYAMGEMKIKRAEQNLRVRQLLTKEAQLAVEHRQLSNLLAAPIEAERVIEHEYAGAQVRR